MNHSISPIDAGFSAERLQRIDEFLQQKYVQSGRMPVAATAQYLLGRQHAIGTGSVINNHRLIDLGLKKPGQMPRGHIGHTARWKWDNQSNCFIGLGRWPGY